MRTLPYCEELYRILTSHPDRNNYRLTFAPDQEPIKERFFVEQNDEFIEVVCFKTTYLLVFKECHEYFLGIDIRNPPRGFDTYYATVGLLLTTPENKTALNLHLDFLMGQLGKFHSKKNLTMDLLRREIVLVGRLLRCSNNRLNKSSSLWCFYRKLYILISATDTSSLDYLSVIIASACRHNSNYYCWATARWFFDVIPGFEKRELFMATKAFCFQNTRDSSSWDALAYMISQTKEKNVFNLNDHKRLQNGLNCQSSSIVEPQWLDLDIPPLIFEISNHINALTIDEWPPFLCLLRVLHHFPLVIEYPPFANWQKEIQSFEKRYEPIKFIRRNPLTPQCISDDILLSRKAKSLGYKKRFLESSALPAVQFT